MPDRREELVRKMVAEGTSDDDIRATLKAFDAQQPEQTAQPPEAGAVQPARTWGDTALDVGKGIVKGAASTVAGLGELAGHIPVPSYNPNVRNLRQAVDAAYGQPGLSEKAFQEADRMTTATNTPQMVGKGLEALGEMAIPVGKAAQAVPSASRAGKAFQSVMGAAKDVPINPEAAGQVGLRIMQLAERGGTMPRPVSQFLQHITNPEKPAMTYEVARDFASNISRLSANEMQRLTPVMAREVASLRVTLNKAVAEAAGKAGKGREYASAMNEYAKAMKLRGMIDDVVTGAKRALPIAGAAGAGTWLTGKMLGLLGND